ncbi:MAG: ornithine cyclodeaminase family protein [Alphaproteobacteria bacterium]
MRYFSAEQVDRALDYDKLVDRLGEMFSAGCEVPLRHHHQVARADGTEGTLLLMPAWQANGPIGIKVVSVFPENARRGKASVLGSYLLLNGDTGEPEAFLDGVRLTLRRTACASALAARYLAKPNAKYLLVVGAGALAPHLIGAHCAVRPIEEVLIWNHNPARAEKLAGELSKKLPIRVDWTEELASTCGDADIISCATLAVEPVIQGAWLRPGVHVDLVGAFRPDMRESDDEVIKRGRLYVDTRPGATAEAGDVVQPLARGVITEADIQGDLYQLCRNEVAGRKTADEITVFKSVGTALEDLAAARLVAEAG